jgi:hypothetical protein
MEPQRREQPSDDSRASRSSACADVRERLPLHVGGDLEAADAEEVAAHLVDCAECRADLERLDRARQGFFEVLQRGAAEELAREGLWKGIAAKLALDAARGDARAGAAARTTNERRSAEAARRAAAAARSHGVGAEHGAALEAAAPTAVELAVASVGTLHEYGHPGRRALRLLAGATLVAAAALLVSVVLYKAPRQDASPSIADASVPDVGGDPAANGVENGASDALHSGGLERLGVDDQDRRLLLQPREMELPALGGGREELVGHPTWR